MLNKILTLDFVLVLHIQNKILLPIDHNMVKQTAYCFVVDKIMLIEALFDYIDKVDFHFLDQHDFQFEYLTENKKKKCMNFYVLNFEINDLLDFKIS